MSATNLAGYPRAICETRAQDFVKGVWNARLASEGMPAEPTRTTRQRVLGHNATHTVDTSTSDYWTALTHVVHALNGEFSALDKKILMAYAESGYLTEAARQAKVSKERSRTAIRRLHVWLKDETPPRKKEKSR